MPPPEGRQIWHTDGHGLRHGSAVRWYTSGQLRALTDYVHGRRQGRYRSWHPNGQLEVSGEYVADREEGVWRRFAEDGALQVEIPCTAGLSEGTCRSFYPGGTVAREWTAHQGLEDGIVTVYLPDGAVFSTEEVRAGRRHGVRRIWLAGVLIQEEHWADGDLHGPCKIWGVTGHILEEGGHVRGERHGRWTFSGYDGAVISEGDYAHGEVVGDWEPASLAAPAAAPASPPVRLDVAMTGPVSATLITGFLGSGKTTAILHLLSQKPPDERWVVYVNEFGEVGVDAAALPAAEGDDADLFVRELAGGCACCTSNRPFVEGVAQALDLLRPDVLLLEPTGLANTAPLRTSLQSLGSRVELGATLCLVDPRRLDDPRYINNPAYREQIEACDVLVANRCDLASPEELERFRAIARERGPAAVLETELGRIDLDWLARVGHNTHQDEGQHELSTVEGRGFRFPFQTFNEAELSARLIALLSDQGRLPRGWLRCKGVFDTEAGRRLVNADMRGDRVVLDWADAHGDLGSSRMELLVPSWSGVDWAAVRALIQECPSSSA
ncbi:MAG: GTP-binding protein [Myxococcota bacterium]